MRSRRRSRSNRSGSRSGRKTYWQGAGLLVENNFTSNSITGAGSFYCGWVVWPSGNADDPQATGFVQPSDTTLVRSLVTNHTVVISGATEPCMIVHGLIAFDGGRNPLLWEDQTGGTDDAICPPLPFTDTGADWIIRQPQPFPNPIDGSGSENTGCELYCESRAMRKLPPQWGILYVSEFWSPFLTQEIQANIAADFRLALRSGYTAPPS